MNTHKALSKKVLVMLRLEFSHRKIEKIENSRIYAIAPKNSSTKHKLATTSVRKAFILVSFLIFLSVSAPKAIAYKSIVVETKVYGSGTIYQRERIVYPYTIYELALRDVKQKGYRSLCEFALSKVPESIRGKIKCQEINKKDYSIVILDARFLTPKEVVLLSDGKIRVVKNKGLIYFEDYSYVNSSGVMWIHYYLEMPGEIVNTSADIVEGNKAEWHMVGSGIKIYAVSRLTQIPYADAFTTVISILIGCFVHRMLRGL